MNSSHPFGVHLRRDRIHRGISLEQIARATNVKIELWEDFEADDFSRWPSGIYARQWVSAYARLVGLDPIETVNEFCRVCPQGDRRSEPLMRDHADIVGHTLAWQDDVPAGGDRRDSVPGPEPAAIPSIRWLRVAVAGTDLITVVGAAGLASLVVPLRTLSLVAIFAGVYYTVSMGAIGCTPTVWLLEAYGRTRATYGHSGATGFRRLVPASRHQRAS